MTSLTSPGQSIPHVQCNYYHTFICCHIRVLDHHCWQYFHHIRVLEESQQTQLNFLSSYQFSCFWSACLITVWVSILAIQRSLNVRNPAVDKSYNQQKEAQQNAKLSRTLFIVITASLLFWIPCLVVYSTHYLCSKCVQWLLPSIINIFRLTSSLLNPVIYSFRVTMFREIFKWAKLCKKSKQYRINYVPWYLSL